MDVERCLQDLGASTMILKQHLDFNMPLISQNPTPTCTDETCKGVPMCPSTAYQGAKTLWISFGRGPQKIQKTMVYDQKVILKNWENRENTQVFSFWLSRYLTRINSR